MSINMESRGQSSWYYIGEGDTLTNTLSKKKEFVAKVMILVNTLLFFFFHAYYRLHSNAFPLSMEDMESNNELTSRSAIEMERTKLFELINSPSNKLLFYQLQYSEDAFYDIESNIVGTAHFSKYNQYQRQPYVANGYFGSRIPNLGQGFTYDQNENHTSEDLRNGWPLFNKRYSGAFISGFYDIQAKVNQTNFPELYANGYESIISAIPQWTTLEISTIKNGTEYTLDPSLVSEKQGTITNYVQRLSLEDGIVTTEYTWLDLLHIKVSVLAHRSELNLGIVDLKISNIDSDPINIKVEDKLDFSSSQRCQLVDANFDQDGIYMVFQPHEVPYVNGVIYSRLLRSDVIKSKVSEAASQYSTFQLDAFKSTRVTKYVGISTSDLNPEELSTADKVLQHSKNATYSSLNTDELENAHKSAWHELLGSSVSINFAHDDLMTLASRASLYHLAANSRAYADGVTAALPVGGLSSDSYGGMVFWDTDLWMHNGMLPFFPSHTRSIVNYRLFTHEQAKKNVPEGSDGAVYPWTSGRFGNCTSTGPCIDYEYHINSAVALAALNLFLSGSTDEDFLFETVYPLVNDAATFLSDYVVKYNSSVNKYVTHNLTDPDEYANHVDNGAYTNGAISLLMRWATDISEHLNITVDDKINDIVGNMYLPTSGNTDNITLEYSGMNSSVGIKQADTIMLTYPLENELISDEQAYKNMQFYAMKQVSYGPAMTFPIFSIVSSKVSEVGCSSHSYLRKAVQPYLRAPFAQFSEQNNDNFLENGGTHPAFPFMTAHGGFLQAVVNGLTGLKFDFELERGQIVRYLELDPVSLGTFENDLKIDGIKYFNQSISLSVNSTSLIVENLGPINSFAPDEIKIIINERNPKNGKYTLKHGEKLVVPLYTPEKSISCSISECDAATFLNITGGVTGEQASLMNDGDNSTYWQAQFYNSTAKVLVDLKRDTNITGGYINWNDKPPQSWSLSKLDATSGVKSTYDFLSKVNFGNDVFKYFQDRKNDTILNQDDVFTSIVNENVQISAPYDEKDSSEVELPDNLNATYFNIEQGSVGRFFLIQMDGVHDEDSSGDGEGAKIAEIAFY
ncbi:uncharacterized protein PRCAT00005575001 [Priceomyces carsonii]|uniref:uncharacterized protein n=1 Tax=Priceomyces carsonii TaxID=28549 RepID=UPI002ED95E43|nr:unnamed protein product [Priceomyces carsonii]